MERGVPIPEVPDKYAYKYGETRAGESLDDHIEIARRFANRESDRFEATRVNREKNLKRMMSKMNIRDGRETKLVELNGKKTGYIEDIFFIQSKEVTISLLPELKKLDLVGKVDEAFDV